VVITNSNVTAKTDSVIFTELKDVPRTKVAIIFGAGINGDQPSRYLKDRLDAGISLYKTTKWIKYCCRETTEETSTMSLA
jgi:SanA protein